MVNFTFFNHSVLTVSDFQVHFDVSSLPSTSTFNQGWGVQCHREVDQTSSQAVSASHSYWSALHGKKQYWKIELDRVHRGSLGKEQTSYQKTLVLPGLPMNVLQRWRAPQERWHFYSLYNLKDSLRSVFPVWSYSHIKLITHNVITDDALSACLGSDWSVSCAFDLSPQPPSHLSLLKCSVWQSWEPSYIWMPTQGQSQSIIY